MAENEENQKQPIATSHQEVKITIIRRIRRRKHQEPNKDYSENQPIAKRNYGKKRAIRQRNYRKRD